MLMKSAERVEGKQGKRTAPGVRPHPDHVSRWWSPITSEVVGVSPSAEAQHLRSNSDKANARAAVHAMRTLHLRNQATIADFRTTSGSHLALASARALKKLLASVDQPSPDLATEHHQSGPPHVPSNLWVCPSLRAFVPANSVGQSALSPGFFFFFGETQLSAKNEKDQNLHPPTLGRSALCGLELPAMPRSDPSSTWPGSSVRTQCAHERGILQAVRH